MIELVACKMKANVWVPMHSEYRQVIDVTRLPAEIGGSPRSSTAGYISPRKATLSYEGLATAW